MNGINIKMPTDNPKKQVFHDMCKKAEGFYKIDRDEYSQYRVKKGLRNSDGSGVLAGLTNISEVHGYVVSESEKCPTEGELSYRGYDIGDLTKNFGIDNRFGFEEISYLLLFGKLPTKAELEEYCGFLAYSRDLPDSFTEDMILKAPSRDIMNKMSRSVLSLYSYDDNPDDCSAENILRQSIQLLARMPMIAAYSYSAKKHYFDNKSLILHQPKPELSIAENLLRMLSKNKEFTEMDAQMLDIALMLHAEHGGGNNSTFACRVLSSSATDPYSAYAAAIGSLKGPRHGGANAKVVSMHEDIRAHVSNWEDDDEVAAYLGKILDKQAFDGTGLIYGMGHAVYTLSDPRAEVCRHYARSLAAKKDLGEEFALIERIERLAPQVMRDHGMTKPICANIDLYTGFIYKMLGVPETLFTPMFAVARMAGWSAHRMEELFCAHRIIRPAYRPVIEPLDYKPLADR